jgi:hypothetical protein
MRISVIFNCFDCHYLLAGYSISLIYEIPFVIFPSYHINTFTLTIYKLDKKESIGRTDLRVLMEDYEKHNG